MKLTTRRSQTLDGEVKLEIASPARYGGSRALKFFHLQAAKKPRPIQLDGVQFNWTDFQPALWALSVHLWSPARYKA